MAVLRLEQGEFGFLDVYGARLRGNQKLTCEMTLRDGKIVYELNGLSRPDWTTLPKGYRATGNPRWDGNRSSNGGLTRSLADAPGATLDLDSRQVRPRPIGPRHSPGDRITIDSCNLSEADNEPTPDQASDLSLVPWPASPACRLLLPARRRGRRPRKPRKGRDVIQELGVRSFINAAGTFTALTGSLMRPEVVAAMQVASRKYVQLEDLHDAVGKRIAELLHCPAALVTSGCASALSLATAACVAGKDPERIRRLPDTTGHEERGHRPEDAPRQLRPRDPQRGREDDRGRRPARSWRTRSATGPR